MVGHVGKKRRNEHKTQRPKKKQRRTQQEYNSDSESEGEQGFDAVNLLDSDDDIHNARVDDGASDDDGDSSSSSDEEARKVTRKKVQKTSKPKSKSPVVESTRKEEEGESGDDDEEDEEDDDEEEEEDDGDVDMDASEKKAKSKRHDPTAFATSLSKILSTKLSASKRSDPVLSRSAAAHEASKAAVDNALEAKAKRKLKEQKRIAMERGRVKDVLVPATHDVSGEPEMTTSEILEMERKLRKIAQRGVVKLFNAVRAAQVQATEAEKVARKTGIIGVKNREEKVNELSKKGFLELIASGGGGLKKGPLEEA